MENTFQQIPEKPGYLSILNRVKPIMFAVTIACLGHSLLSLLIPVAYIEANASNFEIGLAVAVFSIGLFLGCYIGPGFISGVGHIRTFGIIVAVFVISSVLHGFIPIGFWILPLRFSVGLVMGAFFITVESWLSGAADSNTRGGVLGLYQAFVTLGYGLAPWILNFVDASDLRLYSLCGLFMCIALIPVANSRRPAPEVIQSQSIYNFKQLFLDSPTGFIGAAIAGLTLAPLYNQTIVFFKSLNTDQLDFSLLLMTVYLGGIAFQVPIGFFADKFDKRKVLIVLLLITLVTSQYVIYLTEHNYSFWLMFASHLLMAGSLSCQYSLSFNLMFDQIDKNKSVEATSSIFIVHSIGITLGPLIVGLLMDLFNTNALFDFYTYISFGFITYLIVRVYIFRIRIDQEDLPYMINVQNLMPTNLNLNPRFDYYLSQVNDPLFSSFIEIGRAHV